MKRYTCKECRLIKRASNPDRHTCRKCVNKIAPGECNRPNRKHSK